MRRRSVALAICLLAACGEGGGDRAAAPADSVAGDLALPPSAGAPRASVPGSAPDTVRPERVGSPDTLGVVPDPGRHLSPAELDVDSIAARYRNHYRSEFIDRRELTQGDPDLDLDPAVVEAAQRRTALEWGYVEQNAWDQMLADLSESQRLELARRVDAFHRELQQ